MTPHSFDAETLVEALRHQAAERPDAEHLTLLEPGGPLSVTFGELLAEAEAVARGLRSRGVEPRHTVALMLPTGRDFFSSFLGTLLAGAVPVPVYPPVKVDQIEEYAGRQVGILRNAEARALITVRQAENLALLLRPQVPSLETIVRPEKLAASPGPRAAASTEGMGSPEAGDLALIQYTSGSTGDPKGVSLTHGNLVANVRSIGEAVEVQGDDVVICWLPLYHDMGLIGCWLYSLCYGLRMICFSPLAFLRRPRRWLEAVTEYRGSLSPAPNFAYELCLRRLEDADLEGLDLSSWRVAISGAEPIDPGTVERFGERFGACGFRPEALMPAYGLAENAVALTLGPVAEPPRIDRVERDTFQHHHRAVAVGDDDDGESLRFVSVGRPIAGNEVRLVDAKGRPAGERLEAEIQFRGPSATAGYYKNPEATAAIRTADGWLKTGDRGYLADGELYVTGRVKDVIIKAGRNLHPAEVESAAAAVDGIRKGCVAAFGVPSAKTGSEDLVVVAETRQKDPEARRRLASEVKRRVAAEVRVSPDAVELVPPRTVPKTPSGKLRRAETRERFLAGALVPRRLPVWLQVLRLAGAGAGAFLLARLWRGPIARWRSASEEADEETAGEEAGGKEVSSR